MSGIKETIRESELITVRATLHAAERQIATLRADNEKLVGGNYKLRAERDAAIAEVGRMVANREALWNLVPRDDRIKCCEGGGPEDRDGSVSLSVARLIYTREQVTRQRDAAAERERVLVEALPDPDRLNLLAAWLDTQDDEKGYKGDRDVQADLRRWAASACAALAGERRRSELIHRKHHGGLSADEQTELDRLQAASEEALRRELAPTVERMRKEQP